LVTQKQASGDLGPGAGNADERHSPMRVFDRKLQRGAHLLGIERAMARLIEPARILLDEGAVAKLAPGTDACRIAAQAAVDADRAVVGATLARKAHREIGIALP